MFISIPMHQFEEKDSIQLYSFTAPEDMVITIKYYGMLEWNRYHSITKPFKLKKGKSIRFYNQHDEADVANSIKHYHCGKENSDGKFAIVSKLPTTSNGYSTHRFRAVGFSESSFNEMCKKGKVEKFYPSNMEDLDSFVVDIHDVGAFNIPIKRK